MLVAVTTRASPSSASSPPMVATSKRGPTKVVACALSVPNGFTIVSVQVVVLDTFATSTDPSATTPTSLDWCTTAPRSSTMVSDAPSLAVHDSVTGPAASSAPGDTVKAVTDGAVPIETIAVDGADAPATP